MMQYCQEKMQKYGDKPAVERKQQEQNISQFTEFCLLLVCF